MWKKTTKKEAANLFRGQKEVKESELFSAKHQSDVEVQMSFLRIILLPQFIKECLCKSMIECVNKYGSIYVGV